MEVEEKKFFFSNTCKKKKILTEFIFERKSEEKKKKKKRNYKISFNLITKEYVIVKWRGGEYIIICSCLKMAFSSSRRK